MSPCGWENLNIETGVCIPSGDFWRLMICYSVGSSTEAWNHSAGYYTKQRKGNSEERLKGVLLTGSQRPRCPICKGEGQDKAAKKKYTQRPVPRPRPSDPDSLSRRLSFPTHCPSQEQHSFPPCSPAYKQGWEWHPWAHRLNTEKWSESSARGKGEIQKVIQLMIISNILLTIHLKEI